MSICRILSLRGRRGTFNLRAIDVRFTEADLTWNDVGSGTYYLVMRKLPNETDFTNVGIKAVGAGNPIFTDTDLIPETVYQYKIVNVDSEGTFISEGRVIAIQTLEVEWFHLGLSGANANGFSFDKYEISQGSDDFEIALFDVYASRYTDGNGRSYFTEPPLETAKFSSTGGTLADFNMSLTGENHIAVRNVPAGAHAIEIIAGANAKIYDWEVKEDIGNPTQLMDFSNQFENNTSIFDNASEIKASTALFLNNNLDSSTYLDRIITLLDNNGKSNGTLDYSGSTNNPSNASRAAYDSLISKGWTITGTPPPTS
jgi:hypothetical protein